MRSSSLRASSEAAGDDLFDRHVLGFAAVTQALLEHRGAGRQDEDGDRGGELLHDLDCALHVDVEDEVLAGGLGVSERGEGGAVVVAEDLGPLEEFAGSDHALKVCRGW